jgi:hypothetical protein
MFLQDALLKNFHFLEETEGFTFCRDDISAMAFIFKYTYKNVIVEVYGDCIGPTTMILRMIIDKQGVKYYLSDVPPYRRYDVRMNIFDFTSGKVSKGEFKKQIDQLTKHIWIPILGKKYFTQIILLYRNLLISCLENIKKWAEE